MDDSSRRNLEIIQTIIGGNREGSLLATLDRTTTPMGARLLKKNLLFPLRRTANDRPRLETVDQLVPRQRLPTDSRNCSLRSTTWSG